MDEKEKWFSQFRKRTKSFLKENRTHDHVFVQGSGQVLLSAPHGVSQTRLGKPKVHETDSLSVALELQQRLNLHLLAKTKNNFDDANFDFECPYRARLYQEIEQQNIKFLIDFHGLAKTRECDVNLGVNFGNNISQNEEIFNNLNSSLQKAGFVVSIDQPFRAGFRTISACSKERFPCLWAIQIEINCAITNEPQNVEKCQKLLGVFENWLKSL